ncbi:asparagine synthase (glutamine-hydrolyzing) [Cloacibacterium normanense]
MCGIISFVDYNKKINKIDLDRATDSMFLRGPEANGSVFEQNVDYNIGFGHRRLAILDLDERSNQPFSVDEITITYNGEIYNFNLIKEELISLGFNFHTSSDTEVILQAYRAWGDSSFERFIGMFAFVIYDRKKKELIIVRDRLGIKPLYYYYQNSCFAIASEVKTLQVLLNINLEIDESALFGFFSLGYIPGESSSFKKIKKIKPGTITKLKLSKKNSFNKKSFWDINTIKPIKIENKDKEEKLKLLLEDAIKLRMISDVEIGSFISGGLDSSYVTKVLQENSLINKLKTFTIGFNTDFDEAPHAKIVAEYIDTVHTTHYLKPEEIKDILFNYADYFDQPFSDDAAIPMLFLSRMSKNDVKVIISSDGGDEVFAGYTRYLKALRINKKLNKVPFFLLFFIKYISLYLYRILPKKFKFNNLIWRLGNIIDSDKSKQLANILLYGDMIPTPELSKILSLDVNKLFKHNYYETTKDLSPLKQLLIIDTKERLVNQMLVKVDKSTMGASIEGREPLLDHRIFEFMYNLDDNDLINKNETKFIFRKIINEKFKDTNILNKPKMGFTTPIYDWLRFSYADFVEEQFKSVKILSIPYIDEEKLLKVWLDFKNGKVYYQNLVWRTLVYILWYKKYVLDFKKK